jgi:type IV pilus assembly protein PilV
MKHKQTGATLIEIMIAIIVMAIGLLGLASLQTNAMKFQKSSSQRSEATQAAADLGDRMRSNWPSIVKISQPHDPMQANNIKAGNILSYTFQEEYNISSVANHTPPNNCKATSCQQSQIAANDIQEWLRDLQRRLVGGAGIVVPVPGATYPTFIITVMWKEPSFTGLDATCPPVAKAPVGVRCYNLNYTI